MQPVDPEQFESHLQVRPLRVDDYEAIVALQRRCFPGMPTWTREHVESQIRHFPAGQIGITFDQELVASSCSLVLDYDLCSDWHDGRQVSDHGCIRNHDPKGDVRYGIEIMVDPANIETIVMKDLDIELLRRHRDLGTTQNWRDRRRDLYRVKYREDGQEREV
jgi:hypothetical protein